MRLLLHVCAKVARALASRKAACSHSSCSSRVNRSAVGPGSASALPVPRHCAGLKIQPDSITAVLHTEYIPHPEPPRSRPPHRRRNGGCQRARGGYLAGHHLHGRLRDAWLALAPLQLSGCAPRRPRRAAPAGCARRPAAWLGVGTAPRRAGGCGSRLARVPRGGGAYMRCAAGRCGAGAARRRRTRAALPGRRLRRVLAGCSVPCARSLRTQHI
jgi:hypothetical protein